MLYTMIVTHGAARASGVFVDELDLQGHFISARYFFNVDEAHAHLTSLGYVDVTQEIKVQEALGLMKTRDFDISYWRMSDHGGTNQ